MKVLFISDFTLEQRSGGAQVSNDIIIKKGRELGFDIKEHHHLSSITDFLSSYDLVINSNLEAISKISPEKLQQLFENCKKTFFLSQFHFDFFKEFYGDYFKNVEIVYDPIDTSIFKKEDKTKIYDIVYCGYLHKLKGLNNLMAYAKANPERRVSVFGWGDLNPATLFEGFDNITFEGSKTHEEIAEVFKQSKAVFHSPIVNEPFCRMIGEALLCGVEEVIGNTEKIGSYLEFKNIGYEKFKEECENAASIFWEKV